MTNKRDTYLPLPLLSVAGLGSTSVPVLGTSTSTSPPFPLSVMPPVVPTLLLPLPTPPPIPPLTPPKRGLLSNRLPPPKTPPSPKMLFRWPKKGLLLKTPFPKGLLSPKMLPPLPVNPLLTVPLIPPRPPLLPRFRPLPKALLLRFKTYRSATTCRLMIERTTRRQAVCLFMMTANSASEDVIG